MASTMLAAVYATDEDIFNEGPADFAVIVPTSNIMAQGSDGGLGTPDNWTLTSASNNFAAQGITAGMVVEFSGTGFSLRQYLAIETVTSTTLGLRRCGMASGVGIPPVNQVTTGLTFKVATLKPQIENTAFALNEKFSVDPSIVYRTPSDIYDVRIFRRLTALRVLYLLYMALNRSKNGDFADKQKHYENEYMQELASATLRWGPKGTSQEPTTRFATRVGR
jgi:hypothetical protein